jgi:hypothetical protein
MKKFIKIAKSGPKPSQVDGSQLDQQNTLPLRQTLPGCRQNCAEGKAKEKDYLVNKTLIQGE